MTALLQQVITIAIGVTLALLLVGFFAAPIVVRWLGRWIEVDVWAERSCDNVDGGA